MKITETIKCSLFCLVVLLPAVLSAQTRKQKKAMVKEWREQFYTGSILQSSFNEKVHFHNLSGEIMIAVQIDGKTYNMIFDSGAPTVISDEIVKDLKLEKDRTFQIGDGTGELKPADAYTIKELKIGDVTFENTGCLLNNLDNINKVACMKIDGIIGVNIMHECYCQIDFTDSTLTFSNEMPSIPPSPITISFEEDFTGSPYFPLQYADKSFPVELDLGSNGPLTIADTSLAIREKQSHPFVAGYGGGEYTVYQAMHGRQYIGIADSLKIGGSILNNTLVVLSQKKNTSDIGTSFLKNYKTIIDWKSHKIYLNALIHGIDTNFSKSFGLKFAIDNNKLRVVYLWAGSQAEKEGIKIGDVITAVDDANTTVVTKEQYCELLQKMKHADTLKLTTTDPANNIKTIVLTKYSLVTK